MNRRAFTLALGISVGLAGCGQSSTPVDETTPVTQSATASADPEQTLANTLNEIWTSMRKIQAIEERIAKYNEATYGHGTPENRKREDFLVRFYEQMGASQKATRSWDGQQSFLIEILETRRPDLAKRVRDGEFKTTLPNLLMHPNSGPRAQCGEGEAPPVPDKAKACADYFAEWVDQYASLYSEKRKIVQGLDDTIAPRMEREFTAALGTTPDEWVCGKGPDDLDFVERIREILKKHHPEIADDLAGLMKQRAARSVHRGQEEVKEHLAEYFLAQSMFRDLDLDGNGVADYWTGDVAGLYRFQVEGEPLRLIPAPIAQSDGAALEDGAFGTIPADTSKHKKITYYAFRAIPTDASGQRLAQDTDGSGYAWRNASRFAVCAFPKGYGRVGRQTYLLTQEGGVWIKDTEGKPVDCVPDDPGADGWTPATHRVAEMSDWDAFCRLPLAFHVRKLTDANAESRKRSIQALGQRGAPSESRQEACEKDLGHGETQNVAERLPLTPAALSALLACLDDDDAQVRQATVMALGRIGHEAIAPASDRVKAWLANSERRSEALHSLKELNPSADLSPFVVEMLKDASVRSDALRMLPDLGPKGAPAVPALIELLDSPDENVRQEVLWALNSIGPDARPAIPRLALCVEKGHDSAFETLVLLKADQTVLDRAAESLVRRQHPYPLVYYVTDYLKTMGDRALPLWLYMLEHGNTGDMDTARAELVQLAPQHPEVVGAFRKQLKHVFEFIRQGAATDLGRCGAVAAPAVPDLENLANDQSEQVRQAAQEAIAEIRKASAN